MDYVISPNRTNVVAGVIMALLIMVAGGSAPQYFYWLLIAPAFLIWWALRAQTIVSERGISTRPAFGSGSSVPWEEIKGVRFTRSRALLETTTGRSVPLPAVSFNTLPELSQASQGRIPDPIAAAEAAEHDKVTIVKRDGRRILVDKDAAEDAERRTD